MSAEINIHASCVAIGRAGVLLLGKSGAGKSDIALRLIDSGAKLVADDRVLLSVRHGTLFARAPETIRGLLEIRGLGIIAVPAAAAVRIRLAVALGHEGARLPAPRFYAPPLALTEKIPLLVLDARRDATPAKIRAALKAFAGDLFRININTK